MAILFDLDGVFYQANQAIPGAAKVVQWVKAQQIPYLFLTNTSSRPRSALLDKLAGFGIETDEAHLLTPPVVAINWIKKNIPDKKVALFVAEETRAEFSSCRLWQAGDNEDEVAAVVIGDLGEQWNFARLNQAFQLLMNKSRARLLALGMTRYWQANDGLRLDVAPFVMALSHAAGIEPLVMGKPDASFYRTALDLLAEPADQVVMVGDDIRGDIQGAQHVGLRALLVQTGKYRPTDLQLGIQPDAVLASVCELPNWWQKFRPSA